MMYLALVVALVIAIMLVMRLAKRSTMIDSTVQRIVSAQGAMRCLLATQLFEQLAKRGNNSNIVELWEKVEMPLLQAIPDCPPDQKTPLANAITDAAKQVTNREIAKRMMTLRNGILAGI
jgi:hypothetical protein